MNNFPPSIRTVLYILFIFLSAGCGKKGPPLPPDGVVPSPVKNFTVEGREKGLLISWTIPDVNSDGSRIIDLAGFKLYKKAVPEGCKTCPNDLPLYLDIDMEAPEGIALEGRTVYLIDPDVKDGPIYSYRVVPYNSSGYDGGLSELKKAQWKVVTHSVEGLAAVPGDRSVKLAWTPPVAGEYEGDQLEGYRIYRSEVQGRDVREALKTLPPLLASYTDIGLVNNRQYYYRVKPLIKAGDTMIEGSPSRELLAIPVDMIPPAVPTGLSAVPVAGGVSLSWDSVDDEGLAGYFIYRKIEGGVLMDRVTQYPVRENFFVDRTAAAGKRYVYSITSVDDSPQKNESGTSKEVDVRMPAD